MVFVGMRKYNSLDLVCMLSEIRELRQHKIDTGHIRLREHKPAVDKKNATLYLHKEAVATNLAEASKKYNTSRRSHRSQASQHHQRGEPAAA